MSEAWFWKLPKHDRWTGPFDTRDEAQIDADIDASGHPTTYLVATGSPCDPADYAPDADQIIELMSQNAADNYGPEEWPDGVSGDAEAELCTFLCEWARKHCPTDWHIVDGEQFTVHSVPEGKHIVVKVMP